MFKFKRYLTLGMSMVVMGMILTSCTPVDNIKKKMGLMNSDFEFIASGNVDTISIQSIRDPGFKFIVTDDKAISDMYKLLSKSNVGGEKSNLEPDYIIEFKLPDETKKLNYVVGEKIGNLYNDTQVYSAPSRLDEGLIQNLSFIRKPRDFEDVYYNSILNILNLKKDELNSSEHKVGIDIQGDIECLKYVFSKDLENFIAEAKKITPNVDMVKNNTNEFDVVFTIKNRGYDASNYKTLIGYDNKKDKVQEDYYIIAENKFKEWEITASKPNERPQGW